LIKLHLRNFKGVVEGEIELPDVSILVGGNNSGKSTILEAIFLAPDPLRGTPYGAKMPPIAVIERIHSTLRGRGYAFLLNNYSADTAEISLSVDSKEFNLHIVKGERTIGFCTKNPAGLTYFYGAGDKFSTTYYLTFGQPYNDTYPQSCMDDAERTRRFIERAGLSFDYIIKRRDRIETLLYHPSLLDLVIEGLPHRWAEVQPLTKSVASKLSGLSWDAIVNITFEPFGGSVENITLYAQLEDGRRVRIGDLGDGAKNLLVSMLLYEISRPKILLLDDLESHMNPRALDVMFDWLWDEIKEGLRVVASTHNIEVAKRFLSRFDQSKAILVGLKQGRLGYRSFTLDELEDLEAGGLDIRVAKAFLL